MDPTFILLLVILVLLVAFCRSSGSNTHRHLGGHSYLYYVDQYGQQHYEEDACRGCIENRAATLRRQGLTVTECVLGDKNSGDL